MTHPTIHLTRGIMASGKSTFAKAWVAEDPRRRTRVNRDDLRRMLYGGTDTLLPWEQEQHVTAVETAIAKTALEKGKDVIVDAMNLRRQYVKRWLEMGYPVEFHDFPVALSDAIARNASRPNPIPVEAVQRAYDRLTNSGALPEPPAIIGGAAQTYEPDWSLPTAWIVDVDGTLARMVEGGRSPYDYTRVHEDELHEDVAALVNRLAAEDQIIIVSGRSDDCGDETADWLNRNNVQFDELLMRKAGDNRADYTVKREIFEQHIRPHYNVLGVFDDRNQVVRAWRDLGLRCYQVADGAF